MLLRIVPLFAVMLTLVALLFSTSLQPHQKDGLYAPVHGASGWF